MRNAICFDLSQKWYATLPSDGQYYHKYLLQVCPLTYRQINDLPSLLPLYAELIFSSWNADYQNHCCSGPRCIPRSEVLSKMDCMSLFCLSYFRIFKSSGTLTAADLKAFILVYAMHTLVGPRCRKRNPRQHAANSWLNRSSSYPRQSAVHSHWDAFYLFLV